MRPGYDPRGGRPRAGGDREALREAGAEVMTIALVVMADYPAFPAWFRPGRGTRNVDPGGAHSALAARLGTIHADLSDHPLGKLPAELLSRDGLHATARSQAICAARRSAAGPPPGNSFDAG